MRKIDNSDLWSAIRGLGLTRKTRTEVERVVRENETSEMFMGQVIAEAARQVIAGKLYRKESYL